MTGFPPGLGGTIYKYGYENMAVAAKKKKKKESNGLLVYGAIAVVFLAGIAFMLNLLLSDTGLRKKEKIQVVKLLKPPPPPEEKPPEPEVPKEVPKQEVIEDVPLQNGPKNDQPQDNTPAGKDLGVDAEGGAGSDGFGLVGRKGGRAIIGSGGGTGLSKSALLAKYGWYTNKVEKELWRSVKSHLDKDGGIPRGKHQLTIHLELNPNGSVIRFTVIGGSGNERVDQAVKTVMPLLRISEPPPDGMPRGMTIKVSAQG
jgi:periplasmic protein TonB